MDITTTHTQDDMDRKKATAAARKILSWHPYLDKMPAEERERLVDEIVREMRDAWIDGRLAGKLSMLDEYRLTPKEAP